MKSDDDALIEAAKAVRARAHAPYSHYFVGSAVLDEKGRIHSGCNVENAAYPEGICAETSAIAAMVAAGGTRIVAIAAVGGREELEACTPCGGCRQRILEFSDRNTRIILLDDKGQPLRHTMDRAPARLVPPSVTDRLSAQRFFFARTPCEDDPRQRLLDLAEMALVQPGIHS